MAKSLPVSIEGVIYYSSRLAAIELEIDFQTVHRRCKSDKFENWIYTIIKEIIPEERYCATCGIHQSELKKSLSVDHNHKTGKIRGLLCSKCNFGIGQFNDDLKLIDSVKKYLIKHK